MLKTLIAKIDTVFEQYDQDVLNFSFWSRKDDFFPKNSSNLFVKLVLTESNRLSRTNISTPFDRRRVKWRNIYTVYPCHNRSTVYNINI